MKFIFTLKSKILWNLHNLKLCSSCANNSHSSERSVVISDIYMYTYIYIYMYMMMYVLYILTQKALYRTVGSNCFPYIFHCAHEECLKSSCSPWRTAHSSSTSTIMVSCHPQTQACLITVLHLHLQSYSAVVLHESAIRCSSACISAIFCSTGSCQRSSWIFPTLPFCYTFNALWFLSGYILYYYR